MSLLAPLRALAPTAPDARVLGLLLAYLFGNNYALLSVFGELDVSALEAQLGEIALRCADGLPLWWAYVCGLGGEDSGDLFPDALLTGDLEADPLVHATIQIFCLLSRQLPDALLLRKHLPRLPEFLFTRIYGREDPRPVQVTFPPRPEWYADADAEDVRPCPEWVAPGAELRALYAELLGNLLKGGVAPEQAWRLFELVRHVTPGTPASQDSETKPEPEEDESRRGPISRNLKVVIPETETLDDDILNMIHSLMPRCTPDMFVFRGHGGVELRDMAHAWPSSTRGFMFACWLNVQQVTEPITLLRLRQGADAQILLVRVLRNSQIGLTTDADEVVCGAPDALVPSSQWVHLAVACRKGRSALGGGGEARVYLNGRRVGAVRLAYPVVTERRPGIRVTIGSTDEEVNQDGDRHNGSTEWLLGRTLLVDEVLSEEIITLMYRLGSRYHGNLQEALNKFLTYAGATAIHLYLYEQSQGALPNSALVRALRTGPTIPEDTIMLSLCAKDMLDPDTVLNAAIPHAARARDFPNARARLHGAVFAYCGNDLDASIAAVGGGIVALKLVDLAKGNQLLTALEILRDMIKNSWSASEEMERIREFESSCVNKN
jgi:hypothetical protein